MQFQFQTLKPQFKNNSYDGFRFHGTYIVFSKSMSDRIYNSQVEHVQIRFDKKTNAFQLKFLKKPEDDSFKINFTDTYPRVSIKCPEMPIGRYNKHRELEDIFIYTV